MEGLAILVHTCTVYLDSCSLLYNHNKVCQATDKVTVNCLDISIQSANFTSGGSSKLIKINFSIN